MPFIRRMKSARKMNIREGIRAMWRACTIDLDSNDDSLVCRWVIVLITVNLLFYLLSTVK